MGFYDLGFKFLGSQGLRVEAHLLVLEEGHNPSVRLEESVCGDSGRSAGDEDAIVGRGGGEGPHTLALTRVKGWWDRSLRQMTRDISTDNIYNFYIPYGGIRDMRIV